MRNKGISSQILGLPAEKESKVEVKNLFGNYYGGWPTAKEKTNKSIKQNTITGLTGILPETDFKNMFYFQL